jgi:hypothetical protein
MICHAQILIIMKQTIGNFEFNTICLYGRIRLVTILRTILNLPVVTKGFSWKDSQSKRKIMHVTFTIIHKNN